MNERMAELFGQAGISDSINEEFGIEYLAELIVRECMSQIERVKRIQVGHAGTEYTQGFDDGMFVAIRTIEEHLGVDFSDDEVERCPKCNAEWSGTSCGLNDCGWIVEL